MDQNELRLKTLEIQVQTLYDVEKQRCKNDREFVELFKDLANKMDALNERIEFLERKRLESQEKPTP